MHVHVTDIASPLAPTRSQLATNPPSFPSPLPVNDEPPRDGRIARSHRTIEHIVQALIDLLELDGDLRPTAHQVAHRAGVSRRALYLHFDSLEALFATATERRVREVFARWEPPALDTPVEERIDWFALRWSELLEALLPLRRAAMLHEPFSNQVSDTLVRCRRWARDAVERTFLPELSAAVASDGRDMLSTALLHATSSCAWDDLRRQGADVTQARDSMRTLLRGLLM